MSKAQEAIGSCPCPIAGCARTADVLKFRERATSDTQRRFGGKLYLRCQDHGRIGADGSAAVQEWILNHKEIKWRSERSPGAAPVEPPAPSSAAPAPAAKPAVPVAAKPEQKTPLPTPPASPPKKSSPWLFDL